VNSGQVCLRTEAAKVLREALCGRALASPGPTLWGIGEGAAHNRHMGIDHVFPSD
jgi:hypothetical protein